MSAYAEVFQRIEKKYRVDAAQRAALEEGLASRLAPDAYGRTRVTSLYFDTPDCSLISRSLEKPLYKEKLRLRAYGAAGDALVRAFASSAPAVCGSASERVAGAARIDPSALLAPDALVFLEIKKKFKGVVYKRRVGLSLAGVVAYLGGMSYEDACRAYPLADPTLQAVSLAACSCQIARELDTALARHGLLEPSMAIACERVAWAPLDVAEDGLRVTFDDRLVFLDLRSASAAPASGALADDAGAFRWQPVVPAATSVMEIKNAGPYPCWLATLLAGIGAYPASFSKYGTAYQLVTKAATTAGHGAASRLGGARADTPRACPRISPGQGLPLAQGAAEDRRAGSRTPPSTQQTPDQGHFGSKKWRQLLVKGGRCA